MARGGAIELIDLVKRYGDHHAVDRVSLRVEAGEFVTLLGASGSGKTTTLMMIAGFTKPDTGSIRLDDRDILSLPPERRGLGVVFQSYALFPNYDVFENVAFPLRLRRIPEPELKGRVRAVLDRVHLAAFADRRIQQLSGGQQQRVALARAIVFEPPVLLMDEPLGALDRRLRDELQTEIKRIQRELNVTVIYVTHDQEEALAMSDRIAIMQDGRIVQVGSPDHVYQQPASPFVASFLGESNFIDVTRVGSEGPLLQTASDKDGSVIFGVPQGGAEGSDKLVAAVRPEAIVVAPATDARQNAVTGLLELREFLGVTVRLQVRCTLGHLVVRVPRIELDPEIRAGSSIHLTWRASDTLLFPR